MGGERGGAIAGSCIATARPVGAVPRTAPAWLGTGKALALGAAWLDATGANSGSDAGAAADAAGARAAGAAQPASPEPAGVPPTINTDAARKQG